MIKLSKQPIEQYYFVKNGIIFNISEKNLKDDKCGILMGNNATKKYLPQISVKKSGTTQTEVYYLDTLISDGDTAASGKTSGTTVLSGFTKQDHSSEEGMKYIEYYKKICQERINDVVCAYFFSDDDKLKEEVRKYVPLYMLSGSGYTVTSNEGYLTPQINCNEENYFKDIKSDLIKNYIFNDAKTIAERYGYKLTTPSGTTEIEIESILE